MVLDGSRGTPPRALPLALQLEGPCRHLQREGTPGKRWVLGRDSEFPERSLKYV